MAQWLRACTALAGDPGSVTSTHAWQLLTAHSSGTADLTPSLDLGGTCHTCVQSPLSVLVALLAQLPE